MRALRRLHAHGLCWLVLGLAAAACQRGSRSGMSDSTYVLVMAELRRAQTEHATDSLAAAAARAKVLQGRGLTAAALDQAAREIAGDPARASKIFQSIAQHASTSTQPPPITSAPAAHMVPPAQPAASGMPGGLPPVPPVPPGRPAGKPRAAVPQ